MVLAELRRVLQISEARGDEIAEEVIKGATASAVTSPLTFLVSCRSQITLSQTPTKI